jgi:hypothetical protein
MKQPLFGSESLWLLRLFFGFGAAVAYSNQETKTKNKRNQGDKSTLARANNFRKINTLTTLFM